ncbi:MAG: NAD-dependent deacylase [Planctomycetes bacterium]|nr:NAD-dependent deacylase [Planctomycetota bacterium]
MNNPDFSAQKIVFQNVLKGCRKVVISSGAGISAESGIKTFRGQGGIWQKLKPEELATFDAFMRNPAIVWEFYNYRRKIVDEVQPNPGHFALADFEEKWTTYGRIFSIITQNVDGLHACAGSKTIREIHGNINKMKCSKCDFKADSCEIEVSEKFSASGTNQDKILTPEITCDDLPKCPECSAFLRPDIVWFGEMLDPQVLMSVEHDIYTTDMMIVVGTSLNVTPAASFPFQAKMQGAKIALVNFEETIYDEQFDFVFTGKSGEILPLLLDDFSLN